jgi:hypothetical protein
MSAHEYTPQEALAILLNRVRERNQELADRIAEAVDAGKDVSRREPSSDGGKRARLYRKVEPYTYEEALQVAIDALQAHLLEQPLCVNSFLENARESAVGTGQPVARAEKMDFWTQTEAEVLRTGSGAEREARAEIGVSKEIRIEVKTETQIAREGEEMVSLAPVSEDLIMEQRTNFAALRDLLTFTEG